MYRGRAPHRGGFLPPLADRGPPPPPPRPYPSPAYRDDRARPRPPYHDHHGAPPEPYRRSPPHRRYPSPGAGSHRSTGEYRSGGAARERPPSPRGPIPLDHNLVITVGNELTGPSGSAPSRHHDRDYPPRSEYERSRSRGRSPDRSRAKSRPHSRSPGRSRAKSRGRSRSPGLTRGRSRSPGRSQGWSRSHSLGPNRAKSRGRSRSCSPDRSRAKSRGRSKSRPRSRSRSRSRSRGRSHGQSRASSHSRSKSRPRSRSRSRSSSSSHSGHEEKASKEFKELEMARRRKELEEMLNLPTKSILKKRNNSEDSPSARSFDSPRGLEGSNMSRMTEQLLQAVKGMEPHMVASMLSELQSDPQMAQHAEIKELLNLLGGAVPGGKAQEKAVDDIDDEEKFLYGDTDEPKPPPAPESTRHYSLDLYSDVTEETLYGDCPPQKPVISQTYDHPPVPSTHTQAPPTMGEVDARYVSCPTINPDQNITVQVPNPTFPPGTEPLEESERQALEEYEKIQDLLKTIGLDLGVAEISKMAARTKERLHGNKPPPKTPTRRRRYSSGSSSDSRSSRRRRHSGSSSSSRSRSRSRRQGGSWSSNDDNRKKALAVSKPLRDRDVKEVKETRVEQSDAALSLAPPQGPEPSTLPSHPGVSIPPYPPPGVHGMMPPNYPPPGFGQYGNYLPYVHQQWPPMYPPPNMNLHPPAGANEFSPTLPYKQTYSKLAPEPGAQGSVKSFAEDGERGISKASRVSEEENNQSQKQKVLEEREKLRQDREVRMKKKEYLMKELERLRKQQGELLRRKRREKDGHKDPLLQEISHLQEEVMTQISNLRKEHEAAEKKRNEIDKVALILGLSPSDRPRRTCKPPEVQEDEAPPPQPPQPPQPPLKKKRERSLEGQEASSSSTAKLTCETPPALPPLPSAVSLEDKPAVSAPAPPPDPFEYYDAGNHWCKNCNVTSGSMFDFFTHLQSKMHRKTLDPYDRPWASTPIKTPKSTPSEEKLTKPAKGSEFLLPVRGFFCLLCSQFYGDAVCAEEHVTTHAHNEKYKKQMYENPLYEQRRNLDRQAGLASEVSGKKRKQGDEENDNKDKEERSKRKKEKKDKEKKHEDNTAQKDEKSKVKKESEEEKLKPSKKEEDLKKSKSLEGQSPSYSKKEDKHRYSREEEERADRYRCSRDDDYRYRDRYDDRYRDDEDKYKHSKYSDTRSKYDREKDEGKPKTEREAFKKPEMDKQAGKQEVSKPEPPTKPYDPSKIFCGPSPAMRAKLRKQSLETGKLMPATTSFGKFMWKKKENMLVKEAQKLAAEFTKEDETAAKEVSVEDSFAQSMAVAKEIAQKLAGQPSVPPPWVSYGANRERIRPNLSAPGAVQAFGSMRPRSASLLGPVPGDPIAIKPKRFQVFGNPFGMSLEPKPQPVELRPELPEAKPVPPVGKPGPFQELPTLTPTPRPEQPVAKPPLPVSEPVTFIKPVAPLLKAVPSQAPPAQSMATPRPPAQSMATPRPPAQSKATPTPPAQSKATPAQPAMIKIVSDVAAPGVPENEQTRTVFVKPPPFMNKSEGPQKSEKHKSNLAAANAQDLLDIFYSSIGQLGPSSATKPATDTSTDKSKISKSPRPATKEPQPQSQPQAQPQPQRKPEPQLQLQPHPQPQPQRHLEPQPQPHSQIKPQQQPVPQPQPQPQLQRECQPPAESQPLAEVPTFPQQDSNGSQTSPISPTNSDIQIASVWSLQSEIPEVAPSETTPLTTLPELSPLAQCEPQREPQNHSSTPQSQIQTDPKTKSQVEPPPQNQIELPSELEPHQDTQPHSDATPENESRPGPKTRGKRIPPAPCPTRQTRSQTRYQTRRQQQQSQSEPEPEPASGDSDSAASDSRGLDTSDPGSGSQPGMGAPIEEDPQMREITPETLGLPSDMTSLNFDYDFNFE